MKISVSDFLKNTVGSRGNFYGSKQFLERKLSFDDGGQIKSRKQRQYLSRKDLKEELYNWYLRENPGIKLHFKTRAFSCTLWLHL